MTQPAIIVENLGKEYQIGARENGYKTFREAVTDLAAAPLRRFRTLSGNSGHTERFWALKDVSFEVQPGEVVGIIGRNGAGKSTLLKVLSRITEPTEGRAIINGRVGSLLEVGTGFHTELTGRENIYLNGSILGMSRQEINKKFDEIVDFSGVEKFLDTPVKRYSSGMKIRLGFAVAAHLEPEILIVDEVLAVGDFEFQKKCLGKMQDVAHGGRTVLFVSHNMAAVQALCSRAILLESGKLIEDGEPFHTLELYQGCNSDDICATRSLSNHSGRAGSAVSMMRRVTLKDENGSVAAEIPTNGSLAVEVEFEPSREINPVLGVVVKTQVGDPVFGIDNRTISGYQFASCSQRATITCRFDSLPLSPGGYYLDLYLGDSTNSLDQIFNAIGFTVVDHDVFGTGKLPGRNCGPIIWPAVWEMRDMSTSLQEVRL